MMRYAGATLTLLLLSGLVVCQQPAKPKTEPAAVKPQPTAPKESITALPAPQETVPPRAAWPPANIREVKEPPPMMTFAGTPYMTISVKGYGRIKIKLDPKAAPRNVSNVYQLAKGGFYDGIVFHRIMKDFMIQTGDPTGTGAGGPRYTVPAEFKLPNLRGAVAMARQGDQFNPTRASSSCQFYIVHKDAPFLDKAGYTVIGNVVEGMDVVDKIAESPVSPSPMGEKSVPVTPVVIEKVTAEEK